MSYICCFNWINKWHSNHFRISLIHSPIQNNIRILRYFRYVQHGWVTIVIGSVPQVGVAIFYITNIMTLRYTSPANASHVLLRFWWLKFLWLKFWWHQFIFLWHFDDVSIIFWWNFYEVLIIFHDILMTFWFL